ncbi:meprin A subunit beta-like [Lithobates pipiens]
MLQWPCPWRQATVELMDQNPNGLQRTSAMKSVTTDPTLLSDAKALLWDNPAVVGSFATFPNGTRYKRTGTLGKNLITAEEWLYRRDFLKGGDAFILISMEDISQLRRTQPLPPPTSPPPTSPPPTSPPPKVPVLCAENNCLNDGICVMENQQPACRCKTSGDRWYVGNRCEKEIRNKGTVWTMSSLCALLSLFMLTLVNVV